MHIFNFLSKLVANCDVNIMNWVMQQKIETLFLT